MSEPSKSRFSSRQARALLPKTGMGATALWVTSILVALVVLAAAGGLALGNLAANARADIAGALTVQILEPDEQKRDALAEQAADLLTDEPQVRAVRIVPEGELAALLEPWLGAAASSQEVPIPALIDVELAGPATAAEIVALELALSEAVPQARIDAQSRWLAPVYDALDAVRYLAAALIVLIALATAAAVGLSARNAFANHRETVEILHLLGATDRQVSAVFLRSVARDAALGAFAGLAIAVSAIWLIGGQFSALDSAMVAGGGLGLLDWLVLALIPVAAVFLAAFAARVTLMRAMRKLA